MQYRFPNSERLKSRKAIEGLFKAGNSFLAYPVKVVWAVQSQTAEAQVQLAVSVPKRVFKSAVKRNLIRRRIKEAWRLNKPKLLETNQETERQYAVMLIYVGRTELSYTEIEPGIKKALRGLTAAWKQSAPHT